MPEDNDRTGASFAIIGPGKVGTAVGYLLRQAGHAIVAVSGRSAANLDLALTYTGGRRYTDATEAARSADCILITTSDDAIASVCEDIARKGALRPGKKVIHMSGAGGLDLLASASSCGAAAASIHPLQSFADIEGAIRNIPGSMFGITSGETIKEWCIGLVRDLGGIPFFISDGEKPLYHAAACLASNYLTTLMHEVEGIYTSLGMRQEDALKAFWPLVKGTLRNIETKGTIQALTGPIARGDVEPIKKHLVAFMKSCPELLPLYCVMGAETVALGLKKKTLTPEKAEIISQLLKGGYKNG